MRLNITYAKSKMTYITGMCLRKSFNLLRGSQEKGVGSVNDFEMAAVNLYWNGAKPPSITMLENDFCKLLKYFKQVKTQHEFTDRCVSHFNISL